MAHHWEWAVAVKRTVIAAIVGPFGHPKGRGHGRACRRPGDGEDLVLDVLTLIDRARALYQQLGMTEVVRHGDNNLKITMRFPPAAPAKPTST